MKFKTYFSDACSPIQKEIIENENLDNRFHMAVDIKIGEIENGTCKTEVGFVSTGKITKLQNVIAHLEILKAAGLSKLELLLICRGIEELIEKSKAVEENEG